MDASPISTQRLRLKLATLDLAPDYHAYYVRNRTHLKPWEPEHRASFYTPEGARDILGQWLDYASRTHDRRYFVYLDSLMIGMVDLFDVHLRIVHRKAGVGYSIDVEHQGRGFATEAVGAVVDYAFETLELDRIETTYSPLNAASGKVLRKLGFVVEGYARDYIYINGRWQDAIRVAKLNEAKFH